MSEEDHEEDEAPAESQFPLSAPDLKILADLATNLRGSLAEADPQFIRSAATAILAIERLPKPTPGAHVEFGFRTPNRGGNFRWADVLISEEEIRACIGEHVYELSVGGDTQAHILFEAGLGEGSREGSLESWFEQAEVLAASYAPYVDDNSEDIDWTSWEEYES